MKQLILLLTILVLTTALPKPYFRQHYQYQEQSEAYKNNELQHKKEKAERYSKVQEGSSAPLEHSAVHQTEYHAPGTEDELRTKSLGGGQQAAFSKNWNQQSASSGTHGSLTNQDLASQARLQTLQNSGNLRSVPESTGGHSSYSQWSSHSSYSYGQAPDHSSMNHGQQTSDTGYRGANYDGLQTSHQSLASQTQQERQRGHGNSYFSQQKQDEVGRLQSGSQKYEQTQQREFSHGRGHYEHGQGHGYGHLNHGRGHGYGQTTSHDTHQTGTQKLTGTQLDTDDQTTGNTGKLSNQRKTYFITSSNANTDSQNTGVRIVPSTQTGGSTVTQRRTYTASTTNQQSPSIDTYTVPVVHSYPSADVGAVHQTRRTYTASHSSNTQSPNIDSTFNIVPQKPAGVIVPTEVGTVSQQTRRTYTASHTNTQSPNIDSTFKIVSQKPSAVIVPTEAGTVSQQTRRTYTASHTNPQSPNIDSTFKIVPQKPSESIVPSEIGTVHQTRRTYTSHGINTQSPNIDSTFNIPQKPSVIIPSSETGTVTQQSRRTFTASHNINKQSPNIDSTFEITPQKPSAVPLASYPASEVGTVTHQTRRTYTASQTSTTNKQSPDTVKPIPQQISGVPVISFPSSETGTVIHQTGRTQSTQINSEVPLQTVVKPVSPYPGYIRIIPRPSTTTEQPKNPIIEPEEPTVNYDTMKRSFEDKPVRPVANQESTHQTRTHYQSSGYTRTQTTTNDQKQQKIEDQQNEDYQDLTQQTQDGFDSLEIGSQRKDDSEELTQREEFEDQQTHNYKPTQNKPQYQPAQHKPQYQPTQNKPQYQPTLFQPTQNKPQYQSKPVINSQQEGSHTPDQYQPTQYQPSQSKPQYQPTQNKPQYQSRPTTNNQQEGSYTSRQTQTYQSQRVEKTEFADIPQQSTTKKPTQQHKDFDYDDYETTQLPQTHDLEPEDLTQHEDVSNEQHQTGYKRYELTQQTQNNYGGRSQHRDVTQQKQTFDTQKHNDYGHVSQQTENLGRQIPNENVEHGSSYVRTNSYSSNSYSQQQPQAVFSPVHVGSGASGQFRVYQTMQIPAGTSAEMRTKLEEQMRQQLQQKMQELQSQQSSQSSHVTYSPIHFGKNSGTGEFQVYQTMQIPAGATEEMRQRLQEQMRQQLEQKMQELLQQQRTSSSYQQIKPVVVHSYGGEALGADCDDQTSYSSSYSSSSSSSSTGATGGNHYSMQLRPGSTHSFSQNMQIPTGYHHY